MDRYRKKLVLTSIITVIPMVIGFLLWNKLPNTLVTHWSNNIANGWSSKIFAVIGLPLFLLVSHLLTIITTLNDPKGQNIGYKMLSIVFWIIPVTSVVVCTSIYAVGIGIDLNINIIGSMLVGIIFIAIGNYIPKSKQSYTVGITLPWTLHSSENWYKTSKFTGKMWVLSGVVFMISGFLEIRLLSFAIIVAMAIIPIIYSFILYKKGI